MTRNTGSKRIPNPSIMFAPSTEESRLLFKGTDHVTLKRLEGRFSYHIFEL